MAAATVAAVECRAPSCEQRLQSAYCESCAVGDEKRSGEAGPNVSGSGLTVRHPTFMPGTSA